MPWRARLVNLEQLAQGMNAPRLGPNIEDRYESVLFAPVDRKELPVWLPQTHLGICMNLAGDSNPLKETPLIQCAENEPCEPCGFGSPC